MKLYTVIPLVIILSCCTTTRGENSTIIYKDFPDEIKVCLGEIKIDPPYLLDGISSELPDLIKSCLQRNGFILTNEKKNEIYILDIFLHSRQWQYEFTACESITLRLSLSESGSIAAYRLYTENTEKSIDSFSLTLKMLEYNIRELASAVQNNE